MLLSKLSTFLRCLRGDLGELHGDGDTVLRSSSDDIFFVSLNAMPVMFFVGLDCGVVLVPDISLLATSGSRIGVCGALADAGAGAAGAGAGGAQSLAAFAMDGNEQVGVLKKAGMPLRKVPMVGINTLLRNISMLLSFPGANVTVCKTLRGTLLFFMAV